MKKVNDITIGGMRFAIEVDAYDKLDAYLEGVKKHFTASDDTHEILEDIESSLSQKLYARGRNEKRAITLDDVDHVTKEMGDVQDFDQATDQHEPSSHARSQARKRYYRDPDDMIIGGVASGIGAYFGWDTLIIRIALIVVFIISGFVPVGIIYIVLWILVPEASTASQKLEMRGEPINLSSIKDTVQDSVSNIKKKDLTGIKKVLSWPIEAVRWIVKSIVAVVKVLVPVIRISIGGSLFFVGVVAISVLIIAMVSLLIGGSALTFHPVVQTIYTALFVGTLTGTALLLSVFVVAFVPLILILTAGLSLLRMKSSFTAQGATILLLLWIVAIGIAGGIGLKYESFIENEIESYIELQDAKKIEALKSS